MKPIGDLLQATILGGLLVLRPVVLIYVILAEFTSDKAVGEWGYLSDKGLIPMPKAEREQLRKAATALVTMR